MGLYENHLFPWLCDRATRRFEEERRDVVGRARGRTLEVGVGTGHNLPYYTARARKVVGLEISPGMLRRAMARAEAVRREAPDAPEIEIRLGDVQQLEFGPESFDTVVCFLVFCSLPDPGRAASELFRVLEPGGHLLLFEHVAAASGALRRWQDRLNPWWRFFACGCNLNRDTRTILEAAGFDCRRVSDLAQSVSGRVMLPILQGIARKPASR